MIPSVQLDSRSAIKAAKCALKRHKGRFCFGNEKAESGFYDLGLLTAEERQMAVDIALEEITPDCRLGPQPPNDRSVGLYRGKHLFAFCWWSPEFKKEIYFKFAFAPASDGDHLIVYSFHESTDKQSEASQQMMNCFECERGELTPAIVRLTGERNGESFTVNVQGLRCQECGFQTMDSGQSPDFTKELSDAYRAAHGLLTGREIRGLRLRLNMTQQRFADYLGTGVASVKRWESGQIQDRAMDQLIRLKTDTDSARENLRNLQEQNPEPLILFDGDEISLAITMPAQYVERQTMTMESVRFKNDKEEDGADALIAA